MKSLVDILVHILHDCSIMCGANPTRDILTVTRRTEHEGDSFLTITLPSFSQGFERSLEEGRLSPAHFPKFRFGKGTGRPRFLSGYLERVFGSDGLLLASPSSDCVFAVRQICLFAKKLKLACSDTRERAAEARYVDVESKLRAHVVSDDLATLFNRVSSIVWSDILRGAFFGSPYEDFAPRHGPGTTVEGIRGNGKFLFPSWPSRLEREFPYTEFGVASVRNLSWTGEFSFNQALPDTQLSPRNETPIKVIFVPKTAKTPRVIGMEPVCMQYIQQSISTWLCPRIESRGRFTAGRVNFTRQDVNASLALDSSKSRKFSTIDMSDASDRVSARLVRDMLKVSPSFRREVFSCRSTRATLPSGRTVHLRKFASMGSALCFPMEAMAFFIAIVSSRIQSARAKPSPRSVYKYSRDVFVYGDDLIVPTDEAPSICATLESIGFKVNSHKSFWKGNFRESCGMDAFNGIDVTPTYVRRMLPANRADSHGIASAVALANQFYTGGLWRTARAIRELVERLLGSLGSIPRSESKNLELVLNGQDLGCRGSAGLGWISFSNAESFDGWDKHLQCLKHKRWTVHPIRRRDHLDGDAALLKCFGLIGTSSISPTHLRESVRYGNLALKRRWISL
jgi:hypothetical protein